MRHFCGGFDRVPDRRVEQRGLLIGVVNGSVLKASSSHDFPVTVSFGGSLQLYNGRVPILSPLPDIPDHAVKLVGALVSILDINQIRLDEVCQNAGFDTRLGILQ